MRSCERALVHDEDIADTSAAKFPWFRFPSHDQECIWLIPIERQDAGTQVASKLGAQVHVDKHSWLEFQPRIHYLNRTFTVRLLYLPGKNALDLALKYLARISMIVTWAVPDSRVRCRPGTPARSPTPVTDRR